MAWQRAPVCTRTIAAWPRSLAAASRSSFPSRRPRAPVVLGATLSRAEAAATPLWRSCRSTETLPACGARGPDPR